MIILVAIKDTVEQVRSVAEMAASWPADSDMTT
jgi:hypothetical protein